MVLTSMHPLAPFFGIASSQPAARRWSSRDAAIAQWEAGIRFFSRHA